MLGFRFDFGRAARDNAGMTALHWLPRTLDRATSALATMLYGSPAYGVERSALWKRLLLLALVALLMTRRRTQGSGPRLLAARTASTGMWRAD